MTYIDPFEDFIERQKRRRKRQLKEAYRQSGGLPRKITDVFLGVGLSWMGIHGILRWIRRKHFERTMEMRKRSVISHVRKSPFMERFGPSLNRRTEAIRQASTEAAKGVKPEEVISKVKRAIIGIELGRASPEHALEWSIYRAFGIYKNPRTVSRLYFYDTNPHLKWLDIYRLQRFYKSGAYDRLDKIFNYMIHRTNMFEPYEMEYLELIKEQLRLSLHNVNIDLVKFTPGIIRFNTLESVRGIKAFSQVEETFNKIYHGFEAYKRSLGDVFDELEGVTLRSLRQLRKAYIEPYIKALDRLVANYYKHTLIPALFLHGIQKTPGISSSFFDAVSGSIDHMKSFPRRVAAATSVIGRNYSELKAFNRRVEEIKDEISMLAKNYAASLQTSGLSNVDINVVLKEKTPYSAILNLIVNRGGKVRTINLEVPLVTDNGIIKLTERHAALQVPNVLRIVPLRDPHLQGIGTPVLESADKMLHRILYSRLEKIISPMVFEDDTSWKAAVKRETDKLISTMSRVTSNYIQAAPFTGTAADILLAGKVFIPLVKELHIGKGEESFARFAAQEVEGLYVLRTLAREKSNFFKKGIFQAANLAAIDIESTEFQIGGKYMNLPYEVAVSYLDKDGMMKTVYFIRKFDPRHTTLSPAGKEIVAGTGRNPDLLEDALIKGIRSKKQLYKSALKNTMEKFADFINTENHGKVSKTVKIIELSDKTFESELTAHLTRILNGKVVLHHGGGEAQFIMQFTKGANVKVVDYLTVARQLMRNERSFRLISLFSNVFDVNKEYATKIIPHYAGVDAAMTLQLAFKTFPGWLNKLDETVINNWLRYFEELRMRGQLSAESQEEFYKWLTGSLQRLGMSGVGTNPTQITKGKFLPDFYAAHLHLIPGGVFYNVMRQIYQQFSLALRMHEGTMKYFEELTVNPFKENEPLLSPHQRLIYIAPSKRTPVNILKQSVEGYQSFMNVAYVGLHPFTEGVVAVPSRRFYERWKVWSQARGGYILLRDAQDKYVASKFADVFTRMLEGKLEKDDYAKIIRIKDVKERTKKLYDIYSKLKDNEGFFEYIATGSKDPVLIDFLKMIKDDSSGRKISDSVISEITGVRFKLESVNRERIKISFQFLQSPIKLIGTKGLAVVSGPGLRSFVTNMPKGILKNIPEVMRKNPPILVDLVAGMEFGRGDSLIKLFATRSQDLIYNNFLNFINENKGNPAATRKIKEAFDIIENYFGMKLTTMNKAEKTLLQLIIDSPTREPLMYYYEKLHKDPLRILEGMSLLSQKLGVTYRNLLKQYPISERDAAELLTGKQSEFIRSIYSAIQKRGYNKEMTSMAGRMVSQLFGEEVAEVFKLGVERRKLDLATLRHRLRQNLYKMPVFFEIFFQQDERGTLRPYTVGVRGLQSVNSIVDDVAEAADVMFGKGVARIEAHKWRIEDLIEQYALEQISGTAKGSRGIMHIINDIWDKYQPDWRRLYYKSLEDLLSVDKDYEIVKFEDFMKKIRPENYSKVKKFYDDISEILYRHRMHLKFVNKEANEAVNKLVEAKTVKEFMQKLSDLRVIEYLDDNIFLFRSMVEGDEAFINEFMGKIREKLETNELAFYHKGKRVAIEFPLRHKTPYITTEGKRVFLKGFTKEQVLPAFEYFNEIARTSPGTESLVMKTTLDAVNLLGALTASSEYKSARDYAGPELIKQRARRINTYIQNMYQPIVTTMMGRGMISFAGMRGKLLPHSIFGFLGELVDGATKKTTVGTQSDILVKSLTEKLTETHIADVFVSSTMMSDFLDTVYANKLIMSDLNTAKKALLHAEYSLKYIIKEGTRKEKTLAENLLAQLRSIIKRPEDYYRDEYLKERIESISKFINKWKNEVVGGKLGLVGMFIQRDPHIFPYGGNPIRLLRAARELPSWAVTVHDPVAKQFFKGDFDSDTMRIWYHNFEDMKWEHFKEYLVNTYETTYKSEFFDKLNEEAERLIRLDSKNNLTAKVLLVDENGRVQMTPREIKFSRYAHLLGTEKIPRGRALIIGDWVPVAKKGGKVTHVVYKKFRILEEVAGHSVADNELAATLNRLRGGSISEQFAASVGKDLEYMVEVSKRLPEVISSNLTRVIMGKELLGYATSILRSAMYRGFELFRGGKIDSTTFIRFLEAVAQPVQNLTKMKRLGASFVATAQKFAAAINNPRGQYLKFLKEDMNVADDALEALITVANLNRSGGNYIIHDFSAHFRAISSKTPTKDLHSMLDFITTLSEYKDTMQEDELIKMVTNALGISAAEKEGLQLVEKIRDNLPKHRRIKHIARLLPEKTGSKLEKVYEDIRLGIFKPSAPGGSLSLMRNVGVAAGFAALVFALLPVDTFLPRPKTGEKYDKSWENYWALPDAADLTKGMDWMWRHQTMTPQVRVLNKLARIGIFEKRSKADLLRAMEWRSINHMRVPSLPFTPYHRKKGKSRTGDFEPMDSLSMQKLMSVLSSL